MQELECYFSRVQGTNTVRLSTKPRYLDSEGLPSTCRVGLVGAERKDAVVALTILSLSYLPIDCSSGSEIIQIQFFLFCLDQLQGRWLFILDSKSVGSNELLEVQKRKV